MSKNNIHEFLAVLRKAKGFTQQEVADILGVSNKTVSGWETGVSFPDISMLPEIAELYDVTCDELIRGARIATDEPNTQTEKKRDLHLKRLLNKSRFHITVTKLICFGLLILGLALCCIFAFGLLKSLIGFLVGLIFVVAAIITSLLLLKQIEYSIETDELESNTQLQFKQNLFTTRATLLIASADTFGIILPHAFAPFNTGLNFGIALLYSILAVLAISFVVFPIYTRFYCKSNLFPIKKCKSLSFIMKNSIVIFGCVLLIWIAGIICTLNLFSEDRQKTEQFSFTEKQALLDYVEDAPLFKKYSNHPIEHSSARIQAFNKHVIVDISHPTTYRVFLFDDDNMEQNDFKGYKYTVTPDGIEVKIAHYDINHIINIGPSDNPTAPEEQFEFSFDVLNPDLQDGYNFRISTDTTSNLHTLYVTFTIGFSPQAIATIVLLSVGIPTTVSAVIIYVYRRKKFTKSLTKQMSAQ